MPYRQLFEVFDLMLVKRLFLQNRITFLILLILLKSS